ncbi:mechanosensitive ion channel family protein [Antrihabitans cavernicola]|uniref:Mechanosensitive ion channel family protein n=1 Tax=Antrihabitans cavernicola TaxID=2495913 RepID=A0A5A7SFB9_9NOCA|nr:mechanosensitive ion channel family protein [Spelaeibacter cavernicola]KAA0024526.1 mechanosensitive ion channel family protein [Spelaeibacter cavernicola]
MSPELRAFELTETNRDWLIHRPIEIAAYIVLALVLRFLAHRAIDRMTKPRPGGPSLVKPLRERTPPQVKGALLNERRLQRAGTIGSVLKSTVSVAVLVWCVLQILSAIGMDVRPFLASAGIAGVAIGFGAQNLVRDFLSGIFMLLEDQYGVGDVVDLGEATGTIETVGLRVTTLRDVSGTLWYCRNGEIVRVGNMSQGYAVAVLDLPIARTADIDKACAVASRTATRAVDDLASDVLEPPEMLGVQNVSADGVVLRLTVKVKPARQWAVQRSLHHAVLDAFAAEGIQAPYPVGRLYADSTS